MMDWYSKEYKPDEDGWYEMRKYEWDYILWYANFDKFHRGLWKIS